MQFCIVMTTEKERRVQRLVTYCNSCVRQSDNSKLKTVILSEEVIDNPRTNKYITA